VVIAVREFFPRFSMALRPSDLFASVRPAIRLCEKTQIPLLSAVAMVMSWAGNARCCGQLAAALLSLAHRSAWPRLWSLVELPLRVILVTVLLQGTNNLAL